jgi:uncharacterized protein (DUF849 family)
MEDALYLRRGELTRGNGPLVARTVELARALDRAPASDEETEAMLALPAR